jgi:hypothetical protein
MALGSHTIRTYGALVELEILRGLRTDPSVRGCTWAGNGSINSLGWTYCIVEPIELMKSLWERPSRQTRRGPDQTSAVQPNSPFRAFFNYFPRTTKTDLGCGVHVHNLSRVEEAEKEGARIIVLANPRVRATLMAKRRPPRPDSQV